jgi:hypothetical protein
MSELGTVARCSTLACLNMARCFSHTELAACDIIAKRLISASGGAFQFSDAHRSLDAAHNDIVVGAVAGGRHLCLAPSTAAAAAFQPVLLGALGLPLSSCNPVVMQPTKVFSKSLKPDHFSKGCLKEFHRIPHLLSACMCHPPQKHTEPDTSFQCPLIAEALNPIHFRWTDFPDYLIYI